MALTISISGYVPPTGVPLTMAALRKLAAGFAVSISGTVGAGEIVDGSVTPAKVSPGAYFYGVASWAAPNKYTVTVTPPLSGLADGVRIYFKVPNANLGTVDTTLVVSGLAEKPVYKRNSETLFHGELVQDSIAEVIYCTTGISGAHWELQSNAMFDRRDYALTTGTVASNRCGAFVCNFGWDYADVTEYSARTFFARLHADCDANPTIKVGSAAAVALRWMDGRSVAQSQLRKGQIIGFVYDSGLSQFVLLGEQPSGLWGAVNTGSANALVASVVGYPESPVAGLGVILKTANAANTGAVTFALTSLASATAHGVKAVVKYGNRALDAGDLKANQYIVLVDDGTNWVLQTPSCQPVVMAVAQFNATSSSPITPDLNYNIHGVNKIVKNAVGDYTVYFATALPSTNYLVDVTFGDSTTHQLIGSVLNPASNQLTTSVRIYVVYGNNPALRDAGLDAERVYFKVIGFP